MISLLVLVLLSVVVVGGAHAHPSTIRQRTLQERDNVLASSSSSACPISPNYGRLCNVATQDGKVCDYDYAYMGDCGATEEELECLPFMTCTCNPPPNYDGGWDCDISDEEGMVFCPDNGNTVRGSTCTPPLSTSSVTDGDDETVENANDSTLPQQDSDNADNRSDMNNGGIDLLDIEDNNFGSKNTVDNGNGNGIDSVEVTTPAVVDDNDSSTTFTVKGESEGGMRSLSSSSSSSSSSSQQGLVVVKIAMVASATAAAGITLYL